MNLQRFLLRILFYIFTFSMIKVALWVHNLAIKVLLLIISAGSIIWYLYHSYKTYSLRYFVLNVIRITIGLFLVFYWRIRLS